MKKYLAFIYSTLVCAYSFAQKTGSISGKVTESKQALEFATITLAKITDSTKYLYFTNTDSLGKFQFENIAFDSYLLKTSLIGYKTHQEQL
jgi:hypothetical protein